MTIALRGALQPLAREVWTGSATAANPGLLLDRLLPFAANTPPPRQPSALGNFPVAAMRGGDTPLNHFLERVCATPVPDLYRAAYAEWEQTVEALPGARTAQFVTHTKDGKPTRMVVGLGTESVRETGIALLHPYGVPVIPGSALKGLLTRNLARLLNDQTRPRADQIAEVLGGTRDSAGYLTYFDAWLVPGGSEQKSPLVRETLTVHHPDYYNKPDGQRRAPWDMDDPTPIAFLSARGAFLVAVQGPDAEGAWAGLALDLLERALADWGIGAKTSSGYGRLTRIVPPSAEQTAGTGRIAELAAMVRELPIVAFANKQSPEVMRLWAIRDEAGQLPEREKTFVLAAIRDKLHQAGVLQAWQGDLKVRRLLDYLAAHGEKGGAR